MDPTACLVQLLEALQDEDRLEAKQSLLDLRNWLQEGGSLPHVIKSGSCPSHATRGTFHIGWRE